MPIEFCLKFGKCQTTAQRFQSGVLGSSNNCLMVLDYGRAKFNQLLNVFSLESREKKRTAQQDGSASWEVQTTAQHLCSWEAQTTGQLFRSWDLITSNNCRTILDSGLGKFKQLPNTCGLGMPKQLHNKLVWGSSNTCSTFCSWEAQTTDQLFRSWVFINSNNCRTVLDSGLGKFKQSPICFLGKFKQMPKVLL